ncbi:zinc-finger-containing protein [Paenibacillus ginsengarvi]|uniref:Uncharacterized protein n=1 Tax=Paenibacillus ginsengarvi TaxID=400777 RepID=A0A3B0BS27_9BACL|nr:zinc-finger-containing protein [Paenibacillus ginsengarvi]RKN75029.1 hypothetical protein D7M11_26200 [Paenibacillus ginsengarvi]
MPFLQQSGYLYEQCGHYGREYGNGRCYKCTNFDAYVGVHTGTMIPLGRLANSELRAGRTTDGYGAAEIAALR